MLFAWIIELVLLVVYFLKRGTPDELLFLIIFFGYAAVFNFVAGVLDWPN